MYTVPVYLLVGLINLFAKKHNYNIKMDDDPDFQIRVKRDIESPIGDIHDRVHVINMLKKDRIERMKRESAKYNFDQLNMPYTNGKSQIANNTHESKDFNPYATDHIYDKTASPIVKRSNQYSYNKPTTHFDPYYNVKNGNVNPNTYNNNHLNTGIQNNYNANSDNSYQNNNGHTNNYLTNDYNNKNPNNYNENNGFYNVPNKNGQHNSNIQLSYPNSYNTNYNANNANYNSNNGHYNSNNYYNTQKIVSNIQKIEPKNRNTGNKNNTIEETPETSTITILESYIFGFGGKCPVGTVKIGRRCVRSDDYE